MSVQIYFFMLEKRVNNEGEGRLNINVNSAISCCSVLHIIAVFVSLYVIGNRSEDAAWAVKSFTKSNKFHSFCVLFM